MKREDLQGTRGLAVVLVLLFHVFPETFGNGFVGVDIFFVLSGYLMAMIYKDKTKTISDFVVFYRKRFLRLLPVYALTITIVLAIGKATLIPNSFSFLAKDTKWALALASNVKSMFDRTTYWDQVNEFKYLLHTWSLGIEMQYYLMVPFIFFLELKYPFLSEHMNYVALASFLGHVILSGHWSFDFVFSRVWQFHLGALSWQCTHKPILKQNGSKYQLPQGGTRLWMPNISLRPSDLKDQDMFCEAVKEPNRSSLNSHTYQILSVLFFVFVLPSSSLDLSQKTVRILGTILSAVFFSLGSSHTSKLIANRIFIFLGEISYVLYLIHWPVITFLRSIFDIRSYNPLHGVLLILVLILISTLIHYAVEKPLLSAVGLSVFVILACYVVTVALLTTVVKVKTYEKIADVDQFWTNLTTTNSSWSEREKLEFALNMNQFYAEQNWLILPFTKQDRNLYITPIKKTQESTLKILLIGNSYAVRVVNLVEKLFRGKFEVLKLAVESGWEPLVRNSKEIRAIFKSDYVYRTHLEEAYRMKPDVIFLIHWFEHDMRKVPVKGSIEQDPLIPDALEILGNLSDSTKKIVWSGLTAHFEFNPAIALSQGLSQGSDLDRLYEYPYEVFLDQHKNSLKRVNYLMTKCPKCLWYDMQAPFCNKKKNKCRMFDRETLLSYYSDQFHLSWSGIKVIEPSFSRVVKGVMRELGV